MTWTRLLLENLRHHWRDNVAVFLGIALGTAVLTGALFVGDSLRGSLRALTLEQLGWVDAAVVPGRFFRQELVDELPAEKRCGALLLRGSARGPRDDEPPVAQVNVLGVDAAFWRPKVEVGGGFRRRAEVALNQALAHALNVQVGERVSLNVQKSDSIPRETLLGKRRRDDVLLAINVTVGAILPDDGLARFTLSPQAEPAKNAFVPLQFLQQELGLGTHVNAALLGGAGATATSLHDKLQLDDWGLSLTTPTERSRAFAVYLEPGHAGSIAPRRWFGRISESLESRIVPVNGPLKLDVVGAFYEQERPYALLQSGQMLLEPAVAEAARAAWRDLQPAGVNASPLHESLIYLADSIAAGAGEWPYAVVAAVTPEHVQREAGIRLGDGEILLVDWPAAPLKLERGEDVTLKFYQPDDHHRLELQTTKLRFAGHVPLKGAFDDPDWTPPFPGITDKLSIAAWETPPFPYNAKRIRPADEAFWKRYRTTPKAYVSLATGQRLWPSRFGDVTSIRVPAKEAAAFRTALLKHLAPERGGFVVRNVREQSLRATTGSADFGVLFLSFSFFLIVAALLLVGLLVRLNLDRRGREIGLLLAIGWSHGRVRRLLLAELGAITLVAALVGLAAALGYAAGMLRLLAAQWPDGASLNFLRLYAGPASFAIGYAASVLVSLLTLVWATRGLAKLAPRALLAGQTTADAVLGEPRTGEPRFGEPSRVSGRVERPATRPLTRLGSPGAVVLVGAALGAVVCLAVGVLATSSDAKAGSFFGAGALLLTAALALVWRWLKHTAWASNPRDSLRSSRGLKARPTLWRLGVRNAGRNALRSVLTVGLLASATFLIVAVESFHKETAADFHERHGGSGGFALVAETDVPVFQDLNDPKTRIDWDVPDDVRERLAGVRFVGCRMKAGDDASCLNLYQPLEPRVLGVPASFIDDGRFRFSASLATTDAEKANPWLLLRGGSEDETPAIVDANTAQWILKVALGGILTITDDRGQPAKLRVVGLLKESILQSEVVVADAAFTKIFPRREGFQFFLIETLAGTPAPSPTQEKDVRRALADQGAAVQTSGRRLSNYLAVEHTYFETFKALGGLGLLLGAVGLAIVLLRGVWERRGELALLRALGFAPGQLAWLVLVENAVLLALGLAAGTLAALLAVAPHLVGSGAGVLWGRLVLLLALVSAVGLVSGLFAIRGSLRTPLLPALRRE